jgi:hypothetical protein
MTRAEEWAGKARLEALAGAEELRLPSGQTILARRPNPVQLAAWNRMPLALAAATDEAPLSEQTGLAAEMAALFRDVLIFCCVDPQISLTETGPGFIHPAKIPEEDWTFIVRWAMRATEVEELLPFRPGPAHGDTGGDGDAVPRAAVVPIGG